MSTVVMHAVTSLDGYIADPGDEVGPLFDWYFNGDQPLVAGEVGGQAFARGLVDEVAMDVVPVVLGAGKRYFGSAAGRTCSRTPTS